jgi:hypothetical protein
MKSILLRTFLFISFITSQYSFAQISTVGLQAYYPFNGNAQDASGNGKHGIVNGATLTTDRYGYANNAYSFDGLNDFIALNHAFNGYTQLTISVWFNITATSPNLQALISSDNSNKLVHMQIQTGASANNAVYYNSTSGALGVMLFAQPIPLLNTWTHMVMTVNNGSSSLYLDGVLIEKKTDNYSTMNNTDLLRIGSGYLNQRFFNGLIDDIRIYNRALSFQEVSDLYQSESPILGNPQIQLKCMHQGYYSDFQLENVLYNQQVINTPNNQCDSVRVELFSLSQSAYIYSTKCLWLTNGTIYAKIPNRLLGKNVFIVVKHRNSIDAWSGYPLSLNSSLFYDYSSNQNNTLGNNSFLVDQAGVWSSYTGDLFKDGNIDLLDAAIMEIDVNQFASGYQTSDLTGDGNVDLLDAALLEQNILTFISIIEP